MLIKNLRGSFTLAFLLATLATATRASAASYYVDAVFGSDANAGSISSPWKTVAKVNASLFQPGDAIYFKRTCSWHEKLQITSSGTASAAIVFGAYGSGARPLLDGLTDTTIAPY